MNLYRNATTGSRLFVFAVAAAALGTAYYIDGSKANQNAPPIATKA